MIVNQCLTMSLSTDCRAHFRPLYPSHPSLPGLRKNRCSLWKESFRKLPEGKKKRRRVRGGCQSCVSYMCMGVYKYVAGQTHLRRVLTLLRVSSSETLQEYWRLLLSRTFKVEYRNDLRLRIQERSLLKNNDSRTKRRSNNHIKGRRREEGGFFFV